MTRRSVKFSPELDRLWLRLGRPLRGLDAFYERWLATHLGLADRFAELGHSGPDGRGFTRNLYRLPSDGAKTILDLRRRGRSVMISTARYGEPAAVTEDAVYPYVALDLDCPEEPQRALKVAYLLRQELQERYEAEAVLVWSGFKGAHLYVPLTAPLSHSELLQVAMAIAGMLEGGRYRGLVDWAALRDPRRLMRAPYTWNLKHGKRRLAVVLDERLSPLMPGDFEWGRPLNPRRLGVARIVTKLPTVRMLASDTQRYAWMERLLGQGVPDGRKRLILYVLARYLANVKRLGEEEALEALRGFLEASCTRYGNCSKIGESWLRSVLEAVRRGGWKPWTKERLRQEQPDLYRVLEEMGV